MIGSQCKMGAIFDHLRAKGVSEERLARARVPIRLELGGRSRPRSHRCAARDRATTDVKFYREEEGKIMAELQTNGSLSSAWG